MTIVAIVFIALYLREVDDLNNCNDDLDDVSSNLNDVQSEEHCYWTVKMVSPGYMYHFAEGKCHHEEPGSWKIFCRDGKAFGQEWNELGCPSSPLPTLVSF